MSHSHSDAPSSQSLCLLHSGITILSIDLSILTPSETASSRGPCVCPHLVSTKGVTTTKFSGYESVLEDSDVVTGFDLLTVSQDRQWSLVRRRMLMPPVATGDPRTEKAISVFSDIFIRLHTE